MPRQRARLGRGGTGGACPGRFAGAIDILKDLRDDFDTAYRLDADDNQRAFSGRLSAFCIYIGRNSQKIPPKGVSTYYLALPAPLLGWVEIVVGTSCHNQRHVGRRY